MNKIIPIVAMANNNVIGSSITNDLLWRIPEDTKRFKEITAKVDRTPLIMGRKTYFSIPKQARSMKGRIVIVVTSQGKTEDLIDVVVASSLEHAIAIAKWYVTTGNIYIAGGGSIYAQAMDSPDVDELEVTHVLQDFEGDVVFPPIDPAVWNLAEKSEIKQNENGLQYYFARYVKIINNE